MTDSTTTTLQHGEDAMPIRRLGRPVRFIDMLTALLWVAALGMLITATFVVPDTTSTAEVRGLLFVWALGLFSAALGSTMISTALWVVRQFEEAFEIAANVRAINDELADLRRRRNGVRREG